MFKIINIWYLCTNILFRFCTECQKGLSFQGRLRFEPVRFLSRQLIVTSQCKKNPRILHWLESVLPNIERIRGHLGRVFMK